MVEHRTEVRARIREEITFKSWSWMTYFCRLQVTKVPQPSKTAPRAGGQVFKLMSRWRTFQNQTVTSPRLSNHNSEKQKKNQTRMSYQARQTALPWANPPINAPCLLTFWKTFVRRTNWLSSCLYQRFQKRQEIYSWNLNTHSDCRKTQRTRFNKNSVQLPQQLSLREPSKQNQFFQFCIGPLRRRGFGSQLGHFLTHSLNYFQE